jgi:hypothetical protein
VLVRRHAAHATATATASSTGVGVLAHGSGFAPTTWGGQ